MIAIEAFKQEIKREKTFWISAIAIHLLLIILSFYILPDNKLFKIIGLEFKTKKAGLSGL